MSLSKLLVATSTLSSIFMQLSNGDCNGCDGSCVKFNDNVYGCYGTFSSGTISSDANNLCADGYHICSSANEASVLGLTTSLCENTAPTGHSFWTLESSNGNLECYSEHGSVNDDRPSEDVWGCFGGSNGIAGCDSGSGSACGPLNLVCGDTSIDYSPNYGFNFCQSSGCEGIELFVMQSTDSSKSGSLCCSDDLGIDVDSVPCSESIIVRSLRQGDETNLNFEPYVGTYEYWGLDYKNDPIYVHPTSMATFYVTGYTGYDHIIGYKITDYQAYWGDITYGQLEETGSTGKYQMTSNELFSGNEVNFYTRGIGIQMRAVFSDCQHYGFEKYVEGDDSSEKCPLYDATDNGSCTDDEFCNDCQSWGCATCADGYYKMGNFQKCQSCDLYSNCAKCSDWTGCTTCEDGYSLEWDSECNDQICI